MRTFFFLSLAVLAPVGGALAQPAPAEALSESGHRKRARSIAERLGVSARQANPIRQVFLARPFRKEIGLALPLDPRESCLIAPGMIGGDPEKAAPLGFPAQERIARFHKDAAGPEATLRQTADAAPPGYNPCIALARFYLDLAHLNPANAAGHARPAFSLDGARAAACAVVAETAAHQADGPAPDFPGDLTPYFRAARAERHLHTYLSQEPEGDAPAAAEAASALARLHAK